VADAVAGDAIARYLERLRSERGCSPRTLASYRLDLRALAELALREDARSTSPAEPDWSAVTEHRVRRWVAASSRAGLSARSIARRLSAWRGFFDWLATQGVAAANPARGVRGPRAPRRLPKALPPDVAVRFVGTAHGDDFEAVRDQAMLELFYSSGLRLSELTSLDLRHFDGPGDASTGWIDLDEAELTVRGKGGRTRTVPIGRAAREALQRWLAVRSDWCAGRRGCDERALFLGVQGRRLANRTVQIRLKRLALARGVPANVHPHVLRHSFASHLLQSSGDLRAVQELLGHASIATTQVYTSLDFQRLAAVYDAAHPRARRRGGS
jgi:integrase/recombinase XerC